MGNTSEFPLGWAIGLPFLSLVTTVAVWLVGTLLMQMTFRRSLAGGILEGRLKLLLVRYSWIFLAVSAVPAIWLLIQQQVNPGILLILATIVLAISHLPFIQFFADEAIENRLASHLWARRREIEKLQGAPVGHTSEAPSAKGTETSAKVALTAEESKLLESINMRLQVERMMFKSNVERLLAGATQSLSGAGANILDPGTNAMMMGTIGEYATLYFISLSVSYLVFGLSVASNADVAWQTPLLFGIVAGVLAIPVVWTIRWLRSTWICLVCGKKTRRVVQRGEMRVHICSQECEQKLEELLTKSQVVQ